MSSQKPCRHYRMNPNHNVKKWCVLEAEHDGPHELINGDTWSFATPEKPA